MYVLTKRERLIANFDHTYDILIIIIIILIKKSKI